MLVESPGKKAKKSRYCCEDHFDLKNDTEKYCEWREKGVQKKLKSSVLPRKTLNFDRTLSELSSVGTNNPDCNQAFDADCATVFTDFDITRTLEKGIQYSFELTPPKNLDKPTESVKKMTVSDNLNATTDSIPSEILDASSSYHPSTEKTSSNSYEKNLQIELMKTDIYEKFTKPMIEHDPSAFIGLDKENLYRYSDVQSIIDCFEIEIEKPSNSLFQALSWSDYKKCNSVKYLISVTADGLITFISDGVAGRATDVSVVENCGYLDVLPGGCSVLADRGFKLLDLLLQKKKCELIRPPSVQKETKSSKKEVKLTKQIASIRIHVERAMNRIRNYRILDIHARIDNHLIGHLDSIVNIVCGLVNLQSPIIKQTNI
ncbi:hypothetical protein QAD02_020151 [Eretmocerus hayati]|uniref:Uncharacterized protein n=1 Tax=Eretmocerus hayati TaxID=131215 RepID=A0ACC2PM42_9HYME|nr:hypothetical protein QAD02_020151 [Eretmocerus hayati]